MDYRILGDMHTHTIFSRHAYSTIQENIAAASQRGLEILGSADHFGNMLFTEPDIRNFQFFLNQNIWPRTWMGVTLLRACEADILTLKGGIFGQDVAVPVNIVGTSYRQDRSLYERVTAGLDYVVASVHYSGFTEGASLAQTTEMYLRALEQEKVFILGHPGRSGVPFDIDEVLTCAKEKRKLIELNEHSLNSDPRGTHREACRKIALRCAELGVGVTLSTDAHISTDIGRFPELRRFLKEIDFPQELIMNRDREAFVTALAASGVCDLRKEVEERLSLDRES